MPRAFPLATVERQNWAHLFRLLEASVIVSSGECVVSDSLPRERNPRHSFDGTTVAMGMIGNVEAYLASPQKGSAVLPVELAEETLLCLQVS